MNEGIKKSVNIQGECVGVDFSKRGDKDNHALIEIYIEDDEMWFKEVSLSSFWIDDFIQVLTKTKERLESNFDKDESGFGYKFKR